MFCCLKGRSKSETVKMHGRAQMDFRNHLLIDSRTRRSRNTSERNEGDKESYLIVHEETLSDIGNELHTVCTLVWKEKWEIERNGVLPTSVFFR